MSSPALAGDDRALAGPVTALRGMPFLDDAFASGRLLAAVAAVRHVRAERAGMAGWISDAEAGAWLAPARAFMLRRDPPPIPAIALSAGRRQMINDALRGVAAVIPAWEPLLRLPVRFALMYPLNGAISASSHAWPQHVLLADEAFSTARELSEQVVHELCHQWLYLIEEVWPLEVAGAHLFILPSGTPGRTPAEVLGAAHVAAALARIYQAAHAGLAGRAVSLACYGRECLGLPGLGEYLTDAGWQVTRRLEEAL